jgi:heat shock protein HslJ
MNWRPILILFALTACSAISQPTLDGTEWLSASVTEGGADRPLLDGTQVRLGFNDGELAASAGCNSMGGDYRIDSGRLVFDGGWMTEMVCDEERAAQDDWLFRFLDAQPTIAQDGDKLTLTSGDVVIALLDAEVAEPDLPLTGTTWTVDTIVSGDAASSVPDGALASLVFTDDGRVEVNTGCNTGGGTYEATNDTITVSEVITTLRACGGAEGQLESAVRAVITAGDIDYVIDASSLTLMAGDQSLVMRGG